MLTVPSTSSDATYTIRRSSTGAWYCSCPSWKYQHVAGDKRSCKHLLELASSLVAQIERAA